MAPRIALVLAGGGARGAYEVGVLRYIVDDIARALDRRVRFDIVCGTSVGAINAGMVASFADDPHQAVDRLVMAWEALTMDAIARTDPRSLWALWRALFLRPSKPGDGANAVFNPAGLRHLLETAIPFHRIDEMIEKGHLVAASISTTHIASGKTFVFVQRKEPGLPRWSADGTVVARAARLRAEHALASAAIPLVFPAVDIDGEMFCDGGLRQNVPLSPARRLGADGLLIISPRHLPESAAPPEIAEGGLPGPLFLLGKALNALLLDRIDDDVDRLNRINAILEAGERRFGPSFIPELNRELGYPRYHRVRKLRTVLVRPSEDLSALSAEFVRSSKFKAHPKGIVGRIISRIANRETGNEADLLSYLLFDGAFAHELIQLGYEDARARHDELCEFFRSVRGEGEEQRTKEAVGS